MLAHKNFGLPLPINVVNPFRITLGQLLEDGISAPEGCLRFLREKYYKDWVNAAEEWLLERGVEGRIILEEDEVPLYKFMCEKGYCKLDSLRTSEFDIYYRKLSLEYLLKLISKEKRLEGLNEFIELLREQLDERDFKRLEEEFEWLKKV